MLEDRAWRRRGDTGKRIRLSRIFDPHSARALVVPMDHSVTIGPLGKADHADRTAAMLASAGADAIVILSGGLRDYAPEYGGSTVNRITLERVRYGARLARVEAVVQNQDNREHDILDSDDYYQFMGGLAAAVETGKHIMCLQGDGAFGISMNEMTACGRNDWPLPVTFETLVLASVPLVVRVKSVVSTPVTASLNVTMNRGLATFAPGLLMLPTRSAAAIVGTLLLAVGYSQ